MSEQLRHEQIEAWLNGELAGEERSAFERRMQSDAALAREVELHRALAAALAEQDVLALENTLLEVRRELEAEKSQPAAAKVVRMTPRTGRVLALAASVVLVAGAFFLFKTLSGGGAGGEELFAKNYEPYPVYLTQRSSEAERPEALNSGIRAYGQGRFGEALPHFQSLLDGEPDNLPVQFYAGVCHLETGGTAAAIAAFQQVAGRGDNLFAAPAQWYLALAFLKNKQPAEAKNVLKEIAAGGGDYAGKAAALLSKLTG